MGGEGREGPGGGEGLGGGEELETLISLAVTHRILAPLLRATSLIPTTEV